jgi:glyoxylase-like metal-dependent hydrolase (beta-lactamase superfamily II)
MRERNARVGAGIREMVHDRPDIAARFQHYDPPLPREIFPEREGLTLRFGAEEVRLIYPGHAHAPDNIVVFFPRRRLLFGGCAVVAMPRMGYLGVADVEAWPSALERMRALRPRIVVPGHGDRTDPALIDHTLELLRGLQR